MAQPITRKARLKEPGEYAGLATQTESATLLKAGTWHLIDIDQITGSKAADAVWLSATSNLNGTINLGKGDDQLWLAPAGNIQLRLKGSEFVGAATGHEGSELRLSGAATFRTDGSLNLSVTFCDKARQVITFESLRADTSLNLGSGKDRVILDQGFILGLNAKGELLARHDGHTLTFEGYAATYSKLTIVYNGISYSYRDLLASDQLNMAPEIQTETRLGSVTEGTESLRFTTEDLLSLVGDPDGDSLQLLDVWLDTPTAGTLQRQEDGSWSLQPALGFYGEVLIGFQVGDGINTPVSGQTQVLVSKVEEFPATLMQQAQAGSMIVSGIHTASLLDDSHPEVRTLAVALYEAGVQWSRDITYSFNLQIPEDYFQCELELPEWQAYPEALWSATHKAMQDFDTLVALDVEFVESEGDIRFNSLDTLSRNANGYAFFPDEDSLLSGDIFLSKELAATEPAQAGQSVEAGRFGFYTIIHELGHATGLKHPFDEYEILPAELDHIANTLMSYTYYNPWSIDLSFDDEGGYSLDFRDVFAETFMVYDIAALHYLYGPETTTRTGDDTYAYSGRDSYQTLWDAGGIDTLDLSQTSRSNSIDLNPGSYSTLDYRSAEDWINLLSNAAFTQLGQVDTGDIRDYVESLGDDLYTGEQALGIAYGTLIENAMGGSANDTFRDNLADNIFWGNAGDDLFELGAGGFDSVFGGEGFDTVRIPVSREAVTLAQSSGEILLVAESFAVRMVGIEDIRFATDGIWV